MNVIVSDRVKKDIRKITKLDQIIIANKIRSFYTSEPMQEKKLSGYKDIYRIRVGTYRIVYKKLSDSIYIILIKHRRDVYRTLRELLG